MLLVGVVAAGGCWPGQRLLVGTWPVLGVRHVVVSVPCGPLKRFGKRVPGPSGVPALAAAGFSGRLTQIYILSTQQSRKKTGNCGFQPSTRKIVRRD